MTPFYKVYVVKMFLLPNWFYVLKKGFLENLAAASLSLHLVWLSILVFQLCVGSLLLLKMACLVEQRYSSSTQWRHQSIYTFGVSGNAISYRAIAEIQ